MCKGDCMAKIDKRQKFHHNLLRDVSVSHVYAIVRITTCIVFTRSDIMGTCSRGPDRFLPKILQKTRFSVKMCPVRGGATNFIMGGYKS